MTAYRTIQPVQVTSAADITGLNSGNLTAVFASDKMPRVPVYEIYHMVVTGGPALATANIVALGRQWSYVTLDLNGGNEWDPAQPLVLNSGNELYFLWALAQSVTPPPVVTIWPRYDTDNPQNAGFGP